MVIYDKNINNIVLKDINKLITEKQSENKFLEFKAQLSDGEPDKILKTVCGFANANGGLFIYGLKEENGEAQEITGVSLNGKSWDDKKLQIQDWIDGKIEPRLNVEINMLKLDNDKVIILIKVPKSWNPPHCVKNKKNRIFYIRRDGRTDPMEYEELRIMFDLNNSLIEKVNNFRDERVNKFESEEQSLYKIIFHSIPLNSFSNTSINLQKAETELRTGHSIGGVYRYNFEGLFNPNEEFFRQLYRNGIYEMHYKSEHCISVKGFESDYLQFAKEIYNFYQKIDIICPIVFFVSLTNVQEHEICTEGEIRRHRGVYDKKRSILNPNGIIVENENQIEKCVEELFLPIWNHFGYHK